MLPKDKYKAITAIIIFSIIAVVYYFFGKEIAKYVALGGFVIWLGTMYFLNPKS